MTPNDRVSEQFSGEDWESLIAAQDPALQAEAQRIRETIESDSNENPAAPTVLELLHTITHGSDPAYKAHADNLTNYALRQLHEFGSPRSKQVVENLFELIDSGALEHTAQGEALPTFSSPIGGLELLATMGQEFCNPEAVSSIDFDDAKSPPSEQAILHMRNVLVVSFNKIVTALPIAKQYANEVSVDATEYEHPKHPVTEQARHAYEVAKTIEHMFKTAHTASLRPIELQRDVAQQRQELFNISKQITERFGTPNAFTAYASTLRYRFWKLRNTRTRELDRLVDRATQRERQMGPEMFARLSTFNPYQIIEMANVLGSALSIICSRHFGEEYLERYPDLVTQLEPVIGRRVTNITKYSHYNSILGADTCWRTE